MDLLQAVMTAPLEKIMKIFQIVRITDTTAENQMDYEALNKALEFGRIDVADYFLTNNCEVNRTDSKEIQTNTPLHHAVMIKDIDIVKRILNRHGSVVAKNANGDTPLHLACINHDVDIVDTILDHMKAFKSETTDNPKNNDGLSHMHIACARNHGELVKFYLDNGEDVGHAIHKNSPDNPGFTPLHFAVKVGDECMDTVELLLSRGADPFLEDANNMTAYDLNEERMMDSSLMQYLLTKKNEEKCLPVFQVACMEGNLVYITTFLEMGVDVNKALSNKFVLFPTYTPLHFAVESATPMCIEKLLEYGADINLGDSNNMTPLHLALYKEKQNNSHEDAYNAIVKILFSGLADQCIKKVDSHGLSYFHVAVTQNRVDLVQQYLERGLSQVNDKVQRNQRNFSNFTALHFGVLYKCTEVVKFLLEKKADVNRSDDCVYGTPLHIAVEEGDWSMANLLLDYGASANVKRLDDKRTPFHLLVLNVLKRPYQPVADKSFAKEDEDIESLIRRLVIQECNINVINVKDIDGNTALHLACSKIRIGSGCVKALLRWGASLDILNNCCNTPFQMSFLDNYRSNAEDYMVLYDHVHKVKDLGLWVDDRNLDCCKRLLREKDQCDPNAECFTEHHMQERKESRLAEIQRLRVTKLHQRTSLYNVVWDDIASLKSRARSHQNLKNIIDVMKPMLDEDFDATFPSYGSLARLWYELAQKHAEMAPKKKPKSLVKGRKRTSTVITSKNAGINMKRNLNKRQRIV